MLNSFRIVNRKCDIKDCNCRCHQKNKFKSMIKLVLVLILLLLACKYLKPKIFAKINPPEGQILITFNSENSSIGKNANSRYAIISGKVEKVPYSGYGVYPAAIEEGVETPTTNESTAPSSPTSNNSDSVNSDTRSSDSSIYPYYPSEEPSYPDIYTFDLENQELKLLSFEDAQKLSIDNRPKSEKGFEVKYRYVNDHYLSLPKVFGTKTDSQDERIVVTAKHYQKSYELNLPINYPEEIKILGWVD